MHFLAPRRIGSRQVTHGLVRGAASAALPISSGVGADDAMARHLTTAVAPWGTATLNCHARRVEFTSLFDDGFAVVVPKPLLPKIDGDRSGRLGRIPAIRTVQLLQFCPGRQCVICERLGLHFFCHRA